MRNMSERRIVQGLGEVYDMSYPGLNRVEERLGYGQQMQEIVDPYNFLARASELISKGTYPIFYSNHNQHLNIAGFREVLSQLPVRPEDMHVAIAHTLVNEGQDKKIVEFAKTIFPILQKERMHLIPVAREKDIKTLKETSEEKASIAARDTFHNLRHLAATLREDAGFMFFPEATTQGAVKVDGKRSGMVEVTDNLFNWFVSNSQRVGRKIVFVPIGMSGTNNIIEPRTSKAHMKANLQVLKEKVSHQLGIDLGPIKKFAKVVIGEPFGIEDIWLEGVGKLRNGKIVFEDGELNTYMMKQVAVLLSEEEKGVYA